MKGGFEDAINVQLDKLRELDENIKMLPLLQAAYEFVIKVCRYDPDSKILPKFNKLYHHFFEDAVIVFYNNRTEDSHLLIFTKGSGDENNIVKYDGNWADFLTFLDNVQRMEREKENLETSLSDVSIRIQEALANRRGMKYVGGICCPK